MKWFLNFLPRPFLIQLSLIFRPFIKAFYKGSRFTDPIDGSSYRAFLPYGYNTLRQNALCLGTLSLERHRLLWLYLERETDFLTQECTVLHVAPEQVFYQKFKSFKHWEYTTTDLYSPLADVKADLTNLPFEDNSYDLILCNHVLEHIPNDAKALQELYRVLKPSGTAILQVPLEESRLHTYEDDSITEPKERTQVFGQYDHVRIYGKDFYQRIETAGFKSQAVDILSKLTAEEIARYSLQQEKIPLGIKH